MSKLDLEKAEEPEIKLATSVWTFRIPEKLLLHWLLESHWLCVSQQTVENSERDGTTRLPYLPLEKPVCRSRSKLEPDMEQWTVSKLGKEYVKAVQCHPVYLTYLQSTAWETLGWMKHKLESRLQGEILITSVMQMISPLWTKELNSLLMKVKEESGKAGLKLNIQKT